MNIVVTLLIQTVDVFVEWLYTQRLPFRYVTGDEVADVKILSFELYALSKRFQCSKLMRHLQ